MEGKLKSVTGRQALPKRACRPFLALVLCLLCVAVSLALLQPAALACSGCAFNYPWLHSFPTDEELAQATAEFFREYATRQAGSGAAFGWTDYWHLRLERPGVEEQYKIVEVILCFKEEPAAGSATGSASYHFTTLAFDREKGYFFWPHSMGSFDDRGKLEAYLDEYVINRLAATEVREAGKPAAAAPPRQTPGNELLLVLLAVVLGVLLLTSRARHKAGQGQGR